jgi:hypothetical protein
VLARSRSVVAHRRPRDVFAEFYDALEELGEHCAIQIGRYRQGMPAPEWSAFRHQEYDGLGAIAELLRTKENTEIAIPRTSAKPPSLFALLVAFVRLTLAGLRRAAPMRWRRLDGAWRPAAGSTARPSAVAWCLFSKEETIRLGEIARSHGVSLNAWLLWALKEAVLPELVPGSGVVAWRMPVNLRGAFPIERETANGNFSLEVTFPPDAHPGDVHRAIQQEMRGRRVWLVAAWMSSFAWMFTPWVFRKVVRRAAAQTPWQGSFTNLGQLAPTHSDESGGGPEWLIGLNPVVKAGPLGAACIGWRGRLSLTLQIHPALATDPQVARDWMSSWRSFAEGGPAA